MAESTLNPSPPLSPVIAQRRDTAVRALGVFAAWGYREIEVPLLDYFDPLRRALDRRQVNRMFRFVDRDGNLLVLRADVTPAIAKIYAYQLADQPLPLRVCYANKVVRIERAFTREQIESHQLGVELIGAPGTEPEVEILLVAAEALRALGIDDFEINLGHVALVERLVDLARVSPSHRDRLMAAIGDRDSHAVTQILAAESARGTRPDGCAEALAELTSLRFDADALPRMRQCAPPDPALAAALDGLAELVGHLQGLGLQGHIHLDLGLTNEQGYYTGTTVKIVSERVGRVLGGGGRYDDLIGRFGAPTPAVGFSLNMDALMEVIAPVEHDANRAESLEPIRVADDVAAAFRAALARRASGAAAIMVYG